MRKQFLLSLSFLAISIMTYAQTDGTGKNQALKMSSYTEDEEDEEDSEKTIIKENKAPVARHAAISTSKAYDPVDAITMEVTDGLATFQNLPPNASISVKITNQEGSLVLEKTVSTARPDVDIHRLSNGLYFVTLTGGSYRKAFTLERN